MLSMPPSNYRKLAFPVLMLVMLLASVASAQTTQPTVELPGGSYPLTSIGAIIACTWALVEAVKKLAQDIPVLSKIPLLLWQVGIAVGLTVLANRVFDTLPGELEQLIGTAIFSALAAGGLFTSVAALTSTPADEAKRTGFTFLPLLLVAMLVSGCAAIDPNADRLVVQTERSQQMSFEVVNTFLEVEHEHRDLVRAKLPAVHQFAESLRRNYREADQSVTAALNAYKLTRADEDRDRVEKSLAVIQQLAATARKYLAEVYRAKAD